ncbi:serine hydrolase [Thermomonospora umbrina]|uniref:serine hydrolase n=1 Tax=Thermomonospora umbrina TaxID=111806 RepID=UPI0024832981|nr:serine hydrolase domain-containing protein [Thermomonospora umbrina]
MTPGSKRSSVRPGSPASASPSTRTASPGTSAASAGPTGPATSRWTAVTSVTSASVSKAVAGVLTMKMVEADEVNLSTPTRNYVPTMPTEHAHTIGQLLSNRGCVRDYDDDGETWDDMPYASALDASRMFWNDDLVCTPPTYHYSTHGYTLLGAALEAAAEAGNIRHWCATG